MAENHCNFSAYAQAQGPVSTANVLLLESSSTFRRCPLPITKALLEAVVDHQLRHLSFTTSCLQFCPEATDGARQLLQFTATILKSLISLLVRHYDAVMLMSKTVGIWFDVEPGQVVQRYETPKQVSKASILYSIIQMKQPEDVCDVASLALLALGYSGPASAPPFTDDRVDLNTVKSQIEALYPGAMKEIRNFNMEICLCCGSFKRVGDVALDRYKLCSFCSFAMCTSSPL